MGEWQLFFQQLVDPLVLWQRVLLLVLLLVVVICLLLLWRARSAKRRLQALHDNHQAREESRPDALLDTSPHPVETEATSNNEATQTSFKASAATEQQEQQSRPASATTSNNIDTGSDNDPAALLNRIIACWKNGQNNSLAKEARIHALREGLKLLHNLPVEGISPEMKNDWPFMFEGELRNLESAA